MNSFTYRIVAFCTIVLLAAAGCSEPEATAPLDQANNGDGSLGKPAGHFLVEYANEKQMEKAVQQVGGSLDRVFDQIGVAQVSGINDQDAQALSSKPGIQHVTRDVEIQWVPSLQQMMSGSYLTATSLVPQSNPASAAYFGLQWGMQAIMAPSAWSITQSSSDVRVGILDSGISPDHVDLAGKYDLSKSRNFSISNPGDPADYQDRHGHGTHVSGIVSSNNVGVAGVAPNATLVGVKVLGDQGFAPFANVLAGIMYAADEGDCDIINLSLGGYGPRQASGRFISMVYRAMNYANSQGVLVVCAAGNDAMDMDHNKNIVVLPAEAGAGMVVSATGPTFGQTPDGVACYTNYGTSAISVAAPGGNFDCANSSLNALGDLVLSCFSPYVANQLGHPNPTAAYYWAAGTSMAAPHVAGVAALTESAKGNSNPGYLKARLQNTADDLGAAGADPYYGKGRVNAYNAVQ